MNHWHFIAPPNEAVEKTMGIARCGKCGRVLTDPESVAKGIGPVCEEHGVAKSFPGHRGRPGKVGGSLPRKAGEKPKGKKRAPKGGKGYKNVPRGETLGMHDARFLANRTEALSEFHERRLPEDDAQVLAGMVARHGLRYAIEHVREPKPRAWKVKSPKALPALKALKGRVRP